jgi:TonB-dependent Receptor Plug Domain/Carboxypeptidase regulatory-like domain
MEMQEMHMRRYFCRIPLFLCVLMATLTQLSAQTGVGSANRSMRGSSGVIAGSAVDAGGAVLRGAIVRLRPGEVSRVTDGAGNFAISDLAPGTYMLTISYVGFSPFSTNVTITSSQTTHVEAKLTVASSTEAVTVYAGRSYGEAEAINRERASDNIVQVLPADVITSLPNANVADAIGRLPSVTLERDEGEGKYVQIRGTEPRLSNLTIDGIKVPSPESGVRQVKLDTIPADLVESVEINKTLQANMDGDGIGGSVDLKTKSAGNTPTLDLTGIGGWTPIINSRYVTQFGTTLGQRFGADKRLGILVGSSYDYNGRGIEKIQGTSDPRRVARRCLLTVLLACGCSRHHTGGSLLAGERALSLCGLRRHTLHGSF